jgi:hypothetical protein
MYWRFQLATMKFTSIKLRMKITSTEWHNLVVRNKAAELCEKYFQRIKYMLKAGSNRVNGKQRMEVQNTHQKSSN